MVNATPRPFYPREGDPVPYCIGVGVGSSAGLDGCGKFRPTGISFLYCLVVCTYNTNIHVPGGIRTRNPSKRWPQTHALDRSATGIGTDRRARSASLYRQSYPGPRHKMQTYTNYSYVSLWAQICLPLAGPVPPATVLCIKEGCCGLCRCRLQLLILWNVCRFLASRRSCLFVIDCRVMKHDFRLVTCPVVRCLLGMSSRGVQLRTFSDITYLAFVWQIMYCEIRL